MATDDHPRLGLIEDGDGESEHDHRGRIGVAGIDVLVIEDSHRHTMPRALHNVEGRANVVDEEGSLVGISVVVPREAETQLLSKRIELALMFTMQLPRAS